MPRDPDRLAEAVLDIIEAPLRRMAERIAILEARPRPERGEKGEMGDTGRRGADGRDGLDGKDGRDGRDGVDGFGFDDLYVNYDGVRGLTFGFEKGERVREFPLELPLSIYRGNYDPAAFYALGDQVTAGGSLWHCNAATSERPEDGKAEWTRAVRRGRDGKNGERGEKGETGAPGRAGRDLTQMAPDGSKW